MNRGKKEVSVVGIAILLLATGSVSLARYSGGNGVPPKGRLKMYRTRMAVR